MCCVAIEDIELLIEVDYDCSTKILRELIIICALEIGRLRPASGYCFEFVLIRRNVADVAQSRPISLDNPFLTLILQTIRNMSEFQNNSESDHMEVFV